jgi:hypothetical protein
VEEYHLQFPFSSAHLPPTTLLKSRGKVRRRAGRAGAFWRLRWREI